MKTTYALLTTAAFFAVLVMNFGYQNLYFNYLYWNCWDRCIVFESEECDKICKESEKKPELTPESFLAQSVIENKQKSKQLREMYHPILHEYADSIRETRWIVFSHGSSWSHPESIHENLEAEFNYSDGIFHYRQKLDIVSPVLQTEGDDDNDAGRISVTKEIIFPELGVFLVFIVGAFTLAGFQIRRKNTAAGDMSGYI